MRAAGLAALAVAVALSAAMPACAAGEDRLVSPSSALATAASLSPAGWTFFERCDDSSPSGTAAGPGRCSALALSGPTPADGCDGSRPSCGVEAAHVPAREGGTGPVTPLYSLGLARPGQPPDHLIGSGLAAASLAVAAATSFTNGPHESFHFKNEGWFGRDAYAGGADKAMHFVVPAILTKELIPVYADLGYSRTEAHLISFGVASLSGLVVELGDSVNRYGFSYEDLVMDIGGAATATLISAAGVGDVVGFRWGFLFPRELGTCCQVQGLGADYSNFIYTMDLKLAGVGRRLGVELGPLKYLLLSVTYGSKGYPSGKPEERERRVGFDVGLNLAEILKDLGVRRGTWWGYALQVTAENVRLPYTAGGFRYDLNHGDWHGPTTR